MSRERTMFENRSAFRHMDARDELELPKSKQTDVSIGTGATPAARTLSTDRYLSSRRYYHEVVSNCLCLSDSPLILESLVARKEAHLSYIVRV